MNRLKSYLKKNKDSITAVLMVIELVLFLTILFVAANYTAVTHQNLFWGLTALLIINFLIIFYMIKKVNY
jgi:uncharacterized integral membrane protein